MDCPDKSAESIDIEISPVRLFTVGVKTTFAALAIPAGAMSQRMAIEIKSRFVRLAL